MAPPPRRDADFDPTTGDFNSGRLPEAGTASPAARRPAAPTAPSQAQSGTPISYRSTTSYPIYSPPAPRTSTSSDSGGGFGWALLLAAVIAAFFFLGQPGAPATTTTAPDRPPPSRPAATGTPSPAIVVLPPDPASTNGLARDGDRITVTSREVVLDAPWVIDRPTVISGRGPEASTITYAGPGTLLTFVGAGTLRIEGVTLARRSSDAGNVVIIESGTLELADTRLEGGVAGRGYSGAGLVLDGTANARVEGATVERNEVGIRLLTSARAQVVNSAIRRNRTIGIVLTGQARGELRDSRIEGNGTEGIVLGDDSSATITGNRILENGARGLSFVRRSSGSATANEIARNGYGAERADYWQGIGVQDEAHPDLQGNTVRDNAGVGIQYLHGAHGTVRDNTVTGNSGNLAAYLRASGRSAASAGGLVLGLLGQPHDPRPTVGTNRVSGNHGGDIVDYRPGANSATPQASGAPPAPAAAPPSATATPPAAVPASATPPAASRAPATPPPPPATSSPLPRYVLSSTPDGRGPLEADDRLNLYLDGTPLRIDRRPPAGPPIAPIPFDATRGASLWIEVVNVQGDACLWSDMYVVDSTVRGHRALRGHAAPGGCRIGIVALVEFVLP